MPSLSDDLMPFPEGLRQLLESTKTKALPLEFGEVYVYVSMVGEYMYDMGFLNFAVIHGNGGVLGYPTRAFLDVPIVVRGQEKLRQPDVSFIVGMSWRDDGVYAQHWHGFRSQFDKSTMKFVAQIFTK